MSKLKTLFSLLKETFDEWNRDRAPRLAAALAYYTTFSLAPFLIVVIAIAGLVAGQEAVQGRLDEQIQGLVGREGADMIQELIRNVSKGSDSALASIIGLITLLLGAGGVFGQLQDALNTVWGVEVKPGRGILATIKDRFLSFSMVLGVGFLLMVSLVLTSLLAFVHMFFLGLLPGAEFILQILNFAISFGVVTLLFAMIYKILPDAEIQWHDVWIGAAVTSVLFTIGKTALGIYLGNSGVLSTYGAAGSLIIILLWIFYSAQILLFGAEFTQVYARRYGSKIIPSANAVAVTAEARVQAGMSATSKDEKVTAASDYQTPTTPEQVRERGAFVAPNMAPPVAIVTPPAIEQPPRPFPFMTLITGCIAFLVGMFVGTRREPDIEIIEIEEEK